MYEREKECAMNKSNKMQSIAIPGASNFRFSGVRPEELGATEYTLVTVVVDTSSSVCGFAAKLRAAVKAIVESCRRNPRAENLLVRVVSFDDDLAEVHGFKPLADIDSDAYDTLAPGGMTALYDACFDAVAATEQYARVLNAQDYDVNAAVYIVTDGADNRSEMTARDVARRVGSIRADEAVESIVSYLIGVNTGSAGIAGYLGAFRAEAGIDHYIDVSDADASSLAKLAGFVSKSIASQSQALGSGAPSQLINF